MPVINIPKQTILANVLKVSPSQSLPKKVVAVSITLTDPDGVWDTTSGNVLHWGIQKSDDNGATWNEWLVDQVNIPFGSHGKDGSLPTLTKGDLQAAAVGAQLRLAILTDHDIALGATVITTEA